MSTHDSPEPAVTRAEDLQDGWAAHPSTRKIPSTSDSHNERVVTESKNWETRLQDGWDKDK